MSPAADRRERGSALIAAAEILERLGPRVEQLARHYGRALTTAEEKAVKQGEALIAAARVLIEVDPSRAGASTADAVFDVLTLIPTRQILALITRWRMIETRARVLGVQIAEVGDEVEVVGHD